MNTCQFFAAVIFKHRLPVIISSTMLSTEEKLDNLIKSVAALTDCQKTSQQELDEKLKKLEHDVATAHEDATERAIKWAKRECPYQFRKKGH